MAVKSLLVHPNCRQTKRTHICSLPIPRGNVSNEIEQQVCAGPCLPSILRTAHEKRPWGLDGRERTAWKSLDTVDMMGSSQFILACSVTRGMHGRQRKAWLADEQSFNSRAWRRASLRIGSKVAPLRRGLLCASRPICPERPLPPRAFIIVVRSSNLSLQLKSKMYATSAECLEYCCSVIT